MKGKLSPEKLSVTQRQINIDKFREQELPRRVAPPKWYENIFWIIFYFFFSFLYHIIKIYKDIKNKKFNMIIYALFFIAYFFWLIFLNVISFILFFIISGFENVCEINYDNYIRRFILCIIYFYFSIFFLVFELWIHNLTYVDGNEKLKSVLFPFLSIFTFIGLLPYFLFFNMLLNILSLLNGENVISGQIRDYFNFNLV